MQKNPYEILNISSDATDSQIESAYKKLKEKYSEERFLEGEKGNYAAKMLTEIDIAYNELMSGRKAQAEPGSGSGIFADVERALKAGDINGAQQKLDEINERSAEWHYLQSVVFFKKNWTNESKKQLELALRLEPANSKYKDAYEKLDGHINFSNRNFSSGNANPGGEYENPRQMGGDSCTDAANCCSTMLCMNCLMNCCCGCH